jgi:hypothetical protein
MNGAAACDSHKALFTLAPKDAVPVLLGDVFQRQVRLATHAAGRQGEDVQPALALGDAPHQGGHGGAV